jgi:glycosyltransferase involved in cell wall biosynthesis
MHIVLIEFSPSGGLFQFAYQLGDQLARRGHQVELLTGPRPELHSRTPGFVVQEALPTWHAGSRGVESPLWRRVRRVGRAIRHLLALLRILALLRRRRPDVVFWHPLRFPMDSWTVVLASRLSGTAMATVLHEPKPLAEQPSGGDALYKSSRLLDSSLAMAMKRMDLTLVLSDKVADYVRETWAPAGPVVVIPHGDESVFLAGREVAPAEDTPPSVLFFGTWTRHKGIELLLSAFEDVLARVPEARLTLAGAVGNVDFEAIRDQADHVGHVRLRPGYVPMDEVAELMDAHRVVAAPYLRANQSGVVHLAHTFGRPAVASRVGDIPDVVVPDTTGLLVEPRDRQGLADALAFLLQHPEEAGRMGREGAERLSSGATWDRIADMVSNALGDLS